VGAIANMSKKDRDMIVNDLARTADKLQKDVDSVAV
jgi:hypothetical protein